MSEKLNFSAINALVVDDDNYAVQLLGQILRGFGLKQQTVIATGEEAKMRLVREQFDLMICEAMLPDIHAADLVRWLRRLDNSKIKFLPVIVLTGHTQVKNVESVRDCGANIVVKKPVSPNVLFDRLAWAAQTSRPFVETSFYVGPDRRFKSVGPPDGVGRRQTDLSAEVGSAIEPNLSQDEVDNFMKPTKVAIE